MAVSSAAAADAATALGLGVGDLEEMLTAIGDRQDATSSDAHARLERGRRALELELSRMLDRPDA